MKHFFMIVMAALMAGFAADARAASSDIEIPQVSPKPVSPDAPAAADKELDARDVLVDRKNTSPNVLNQPISEFGRATALINQNAAGVSPTIKPDENETTEKAAEAQDANVASKDKDADDKAHAKSTLPPTKDSKGVIVKQVAKNAQKSKKKSDTGDSEAE